MAVKTDKGIAVVIQHVPEDCQGDVLQIGTALWNALFPTSVRASEGPLAVSVGLLQSHTRTGRRGASLSPSVVCWAAPSKDVQVSCRL
jgi:hypothetical protein